MESSNKKYNIGIEIGGTNIKVALVDCTLKIQEIIEIILNKSILVKEFKTSKNPEDTIREISEWVIKENQIHSEVINKVCISMFGPLNLGQNSEEYGTVLNTPKPGWKGFNVVKSFTVNLNISKDKIVIELDVNCAAYLEYKLGNHNVESLAYITIGTGVGVGVVINGQLIHGLQHPEGGHINVKRFTGDNFQGSCSIHGDCLEGLVTNGAIKERKSLNSVDDCTNIPDDDLIWTYISSYIAQQCLSLLYLNSLEKIIIGGGIINRESLLNGIRREFIKLNNNYIDHPLLKEDHIHKYIDRTGFGNYSGILSAFSLSN